MKRGTRRILCLSAALIALAIGAWFFFTERAIAVSVAPIKHDLPVRVYGLGTVEARIVSKIGFEVGAALTELVADSGDTVEKGQILARLHATEQEARVMRADAVVEAARATVGKSRASVIRARAVLAQKEATNARQQALVGRSVVSAQTAEEAKRDMDVAGADLAVAESEIEVAQAQLTDAEAARRYELALLDHHLLKAPFDAVVVERHVEVGTVVRAGELIFTLMDPLTVWTLAYVDEAQAGSIAIGQAAEVRLRSLPHEIFGGIVTRIGIESDRINEERRVWIACDRCPAQVYLGEQAEIRITVATLPSAVLVPETAVRGFDGHQGTVWVVQDGRLGQIPVIFGHRTEDAQLEVVSGIPHGAQVVVAPVTGMSEGRMARAMSGDAP